MQNRIYSKRVLTLAFLAATMVSCSHGPVVQEFSPTASPIEEITRLDAGLVTAKSEQIDVLAPDNYKDAANSLKDARQSLEHGKSPQKILHEVAEGQAYLQNANRFGQVAKDSMEDVVIARKQALVAGAPDHYGKELKDADNDLKDLTRDIEKNKLGEVKNKRGKLQAKYLSIELDSLKKAYTGSAKDSIERAKKEDAKKYAPRTLAAAEKSLQDTNAYIIANRHDSVKIIPMSQDTLNKANHVLKVTRDAKTAGKVSSEEVVLQMENEQNKTAVHELALQQADYQVAALKSENQELNAGHELHQLFETARAKFSDREAEVYKKGNSLLIRLKTLEFPKGQATLKQDNFKILGKVQEVVKDFGNGAVVVEGHTDSTGGETVNKKLSEQRADVVKEYLAQSTSGQKVKYSSVGYGYEKPLASNKTQSGRAQNRRVDIWISPEGA